MGRSSPLHGEEFRHPSYGTVHLGRAQCGGAGGGAVLFDSPFRHQNIIALTISEAKKIRSLHRDLVHSTNELIRVYMSETQFAQMITTLNVGSGASCTIDHVGGKNRPEPPVDDLKGTFTKEVKEEFKDLADSARELEALAKQTKWNADDKKKMRDLSAYIERTLRSNLAFFQQQFEEKMTEVVAQAKGEVEAFVSAAVMRTGLESLKGGAPRLLDHKGE